MLTTMIQQFAAGCNNGFLGLKPWHAYLKKDDSCQITQFNVLPKGGSSDIPLIFLAIIDDILRIAGLVAVAFVIYGAIQYVTSQGEPSETAKAQSTIQNALIGLIVAIIAVSFTAFLGNRLTS